MPKKPRSPGKLVATAPRQATQHDARISENRHVTLSVLIDRLCSLGRTALHCLTIFGVAYFTYRSVDSISGKKTDFSAVASGVFKMSVDRWAAYVVSALSGGGYLYERSLRKRSIKSRDEHIKKLESVIHPSRGGSSNLTETGEVKDHTI